MRFPSTKQQLPRWKLGWCLAIEASYPYKAADGTCKSSFATAMPKGSITGYKSIGNFIFGVSVMT